MAHTYLKLQWPACFSSRHLGLPLRCGAMLQALDDDSSDCDSDILDTCSSSGGSSVIEGGCPGGAGQLKSNPSSSSLSSSLAGGHYGGAAAGRSSGQRGQACYRCGKKVYPVERVDVGVLFHRRCFRCRVCGVQLTLRTFRWDRASQVPDEACPQSQDPNCTVVTGGCAPSSLSQGHGFQTLSDRRPSRTASEGLSFQVPNDRGPGRAANEVCSGPVVRCSSSDAGKTGDVFCSVHAPCQGGEGREQEAGLGPGLFAPRHITTCSSEQRKPDGLYNPVWQGNNAGTLQCPPYPELFRRGKKKICTGTFKDMEASCVFEAQRELEEIQRLEEDCLYTELQAERDRKVRRVEDEIQQEMDITVSDMVTTLERFSPEKDGVRIQRQTERIRDKFRRKKTEKVRKLLDRLSNEQRTRVSTLLQKHSHQMLELIADKLTSLEASNCSGSENRSPALDPSRSPPPAPPETKRAQFFKTAAEFQEIDSRVFEISRHRYGTFTDLVKDLISTCETDLQKARAIFRWITLVDPNRPEVGSADGPFSSQSLLRGVHFGTETHHDLCQRLCSYAGLHCAVIRGYSKGDGYMPGMRMDGTRFRNSWAAVCIDGSWCFLNCHWASSQFIHQQQNDDDTYHHHQQHHRQHNYEGSDDLSRPRDQHHAPGCWKRNDSSLQGCGARTEGQAYCCAVSGEDHRSWKDNPRWHVTRTMTTESCLDSSAIATTSAGTSHSNDLGQHSLQRPVRDRDKESPLRQLIRYASADLLTLRNGDRSSTASAASSSVSGRSSDRTSTGSNTTTSSSCGGGGSRSSKNDSFHSDGTSWSDNSSGYHSVCSGFRPDRYKEVQEIIEKEVQNREVQDTEVQGRELQGKELQHREVQEKGVQERGVEERKGENRGEKQIGGEERGDGAHEAFAKCDDFYFITDPEDHIFQHYPDDPKWQLLECPITLSEFLDLPVLKSSFFSNGFKLAAHYDSRLATVSGVVSITLRLPRLLPLAYSLQPKDQRMSSYVLEGRVLLRMVGHKAIFTVAPPKRGRFYFSVSVKDDWVSESSQNICVFHIRCKEDREALRRPYPKVAYFGPTPSTPNYGLVPQTHIDPLVTYSHDDVKLGFQLPRDVRLSYSLQFHGQGPEVVDADFQRYVFMRQRDDRSVSFLVRCPHVGRYVFTLFGARADSPEDGSACSSGSSSPPSYDCLFRYLIDCKQSATLKAPLPRACHRWYHSHLLEPMMGDLDTNCPVAFKVRTPLASDVALLMDDSWFPFQPLQDSVWALTVMTSVKPGLAKLYARLNPDSTRFSPLLEFHIVHSSVPSETWSVVELL